MCTEQETAEIRDSDRLIGPLRDAENTVPPQDLSELYAYLRCHLNLNSSWQKWVDLCYGRSVKTAIDEILDYVEKMQLKEMQLKKPGSTEVPPGFDWQRIKAHELAQREVFKPILGNVPETIRLLLAKTDGPAGSEQSQHVTKALAFPGTGVCEDRWGPAILDTALQTKFFLCFDAAARAERKERQGANAANIIGGDLEASIEATQEYAALKHLLETTKNEINDTSGAMAAWVKSLLPGCSDSTEFYTSCVRLVKDTYFPDVAKRKIQELKTEMETLHRHAKDLIRELQRTQELHFLGVPCTF